MRFLTRTTYDVTSVAQVIDQPVVRSDVAGPCCAASAPGGYDAELFESCRRTR